jgi:ABC-type proline/glycine betaine transport system ATPase subunit
MDSDKILVMDAGRVAEFGEQQLLQNPDGIFFSLVTRNSNREARDYQNIICLFNENIFDYDAFDTHISFK